ncbi:peptidase domain-containing ABC transporter [Iodobacter sp. HSC-16F04]|uniref:Peptidase domain-containing ABC transporter n=1 Tax=Iodobacter violaceini TaxID=3044271 RepID=A0ABX0KQ80_9NEIS|nr:peptidase domain-containing ABC transporter [Iodobacter violacea]NHQ85779.1 peptidase domain-containing ABC transporter [Iodobacter violacea]
MHLLKKLNWGWHKRLRLVRQTESAECGVACLVMVAAWHGFRIDLMTLRQRLGVTQHGMNLQQLIHCAEMIGLMGRPLRLDLEELKQLATPCILHWDLNHFVVLKKVFRNRAEILDPARGQVQLSLHEVSLHFTGVALELSPSDEFEQKDMHKTVRIRDLIGRTRGLVPALLRILVFAGVLETLALAVPLFNQLIIDEVLVTRDTHLLVMVAIGLGLLTLSQAIISVAREWAVVSLTMAFGLQWTVNVFRHLVRLPVDWFEKRHIGDVTAKFRSIEDIQRTLTNSTLETLLNAILLIGTLAMMMAYDASLATVAVVAALMYAILRLAWFIPMRDAGVDAWVANTKEASHFLETMRGILSLRINGAMPHREVAWRNLEVESRNAKLLQHKLGIAYHVCMLLLSRSVQIIVLSLGARAVLDGHFTVGMLVAFLAWQDRFTSSANQLIDRFFEFKMLSVYTERLADIVQSLPDRREKFKLKTFGPLKAPYKGTAVLVVEGLDFSYGNNEPSILNNLTFSVERGEIVALTGRSGCGKTTLLKLVLGIYQPQRGSVIILGANTNHDDFAKIRSCVGTVLQDDQLFSGSIIENITLFSHEVNMLQVEQSAQFAEVHQDILEMPMGYYTLVGEMGSTLSGGQKQRILLARALYKKPELLVLDEATSHLDINNEFKINKTLRDLGISALVIAHRPETIASADRVLELERGQIKSEYYPLHSAKRNSEIYI